MVWNAFPESNPAHDGINPAQYFGTHSNHKYPNYQVVLRPPSVDINKQDAIAQEED